ncbi:hypothetical protein DVT68_11590 [Dyella solisilvae]|uniref:DUF305 domain-containing protein n=1 Tax=Dyella solisilvae TaxID=1920168 RepID=A0A370K8Z6_9GAMM|nr:hypothetical protein [Dyella solisilvae]RDI99114.1 hypothetical protein DVT68_11590 [Dyella solisilvae]
MKTQALLIILAGACSATGLAVAAPAMHDMAAMAPSSAAAATVAAPKLQAALRALWHGHVLATRDYALAVHAHDSAKAKSAEDAVVANARQIADAVAGFYGKPAGEQTLQLLAGHWGGVKALTDASEAKDNAAEQKAMADLNTNVTAIAKFFAGANPNLPENAVQGLFATHVAHHASQIQQIMSGDSKDEASTWSAMQAHMNTIADALAAGIAKQFPDKAS